MITPDQILIDSATKLFSDLSTVEVINDSEKGVWAKDLWDTLEESGLTLACIPEEQGGAGATLTDAFSIIRLAGYFAAPVPLADTFLASYVLSKSTMAIPTGPLTIVPMGSNNSLSAKQDGDNWVISGTAVAVPWATHAGNIVARINSGDQALLALIPAANVDIKKGYNMAGEPTDDITVNVTLTEDAVKVVGLSDEAINNLGALTRTTAMAGAIEKIMDQSVQYATERVQFGRPIGKFQAVQQSLALLAGERAVSRVITDAAIAEVENAGIETAGLRIAAAKIRVAESAGKATRISHQTHGAIGFTYEHPLHHCSRRIWAWREEFGSESQSAITLGKAVIENGSEGLWPWITA